MFNIQDHFKQIGLEFGDIIAFLKNDSKYQIGYRAQLPDKNVTSSSTTAIISYALNNVNALSNNDRDEAIKELLEFKCVSDSYEKGAFYANIKENNSYCTTWSTAQSCLALQNLQCPIEKYEESVNWLCNAQQDGGGWSVDRQDENCKLIYCIYPLLVLIGLKKNDYHGSYKQNIERAKEYIATYKPIDVKDSLIKVFIERILNVKEKDDSKIVIQNLCNEIVRAQSLSFPVITEEGGRHFFITFFSPCYYLFLRHIISPTHPLNLFLIRWLLDNIRENKGWAPKSLKEDSRIFTWTTALALITLKFWISDLEKNSLPVKAPDSQEKLLKRLSVAQGEKQIMDYLQEHCPLNGGSCNKQNEIEKKYNKTNVFIDIPYAKSYKHFEKQIIETVEQRKLKPVLAGTSKKSDILLCKICQLIQTCKYGIADISYTTLNVPFELGFMMGIGKKCAILKAHNAEQPSDIRGKEYIEYENTDELDKGLNNWITENIKEAQ